MCLYFKHKLLKSIVLPWWLSGKEPICQCRMVLEKTIESPLESKEIKPVILKGNQHLTFIGRTAAEAESNTFWPPDSKSQLIGKYPDAGRD